MDYEYLEQSDEEYYQCESDDGIDGLISVNSDGDVNPCVPDVSIRSANLVLSHYLRSRPPLYQDLNVLAQVKLLRVLKDYSVPLAAFSSIVGWGKDCYLSNYKFATDGGSTSGRKPVLQQIIKRYNHMDMFPRIAPLLLPHCQRRIHMVYHQFQAMIYSLLSGPELMQDDNFLFHNEDPFGDPPARFTHIGDINTGRCYRETWKELITPGSNKILAPVLLYSDETTTDSYGRLSITPLNFSLGIWKRHVRNSHKAWRPLGYLFDHKEEKLSGQPDPNVAKKQDYHAELAFLLQGIVAIQKQGGFEWKLKYRGQTYEVVFVCVVFFMVGDTAGHDKMCGHYVSYTKLIKQICRYCEVPTDEADDPDANCPLRTMRNMKYLLTHGPTAQQQAKS